MAIRDIHLQHFLQNREGLEIEVVPSIAPHATELENVVSSCATLCPVPELNMGAGHLSLFQEVASGVPAGGKEKEVCVGPSRKLYELDQLEFSFPPAGVFLTPKRR